MTNSIKNCIIFWICILIKYGDIAASDHSYKELLSIGKKSPKLHHLKLVQECAQDELRERKALKKQTQKEQGEMRALCQEIKTRSLKIKETLADICTTITRTRTAIQQHQSNSLHSAISRITTNTDHLSELRQDYYKCSTTLTDSVKLQRLQEIEDEAYALLQNTKGLLVSFAFFDTD